MRDSQLAADRKASGSPSLKAYRAAKPDRDIFTAAKGGGILFVGKSFNYVSRLVIGILFGRLLGPEGLGLYNLAFTAVTLAASLALLGLRAATVHFVSRFHGRGDTEGLWGALQAIFSITIVTGVFIGIGLYALADPIAMRLFDEPKLVPLLRLVSPVVPLLALTIILAAATRGFKKMQYEVIALNIYQPLFRLIMIVGLAVIGLTVARALIVFGVAQFTASLLLLYFLHKQFPLRRRLRAVRRDVGRILTFSLPVYVSDLIVALQGNIRTVLLAAFDTTAQVGIFTVASRLNLISGMFQTSIVTASMPIVAELSDGNEPEHLRRFYQTMNRWLLTFRLPVFLITWMLPGPLLSIFGRSFTGGAAALRILAWASLVDAGTGICGVLIDMSGHTKIKLLNTVVAVSLTLGLNILLIPRWGLVGLATAALIGTAVINLLRLLEVFLLFRLLPYNTGFIKPISAGIVALGAGVATSRLLSPGASVFHLATVVVVLFAAYASVILLLGLSQEDQAILARLRRRIGGTTSRS